MRKSLILLISTLLFGNLLSNAQTIDKNILSQMKKDAKGSYFSTEEGLSKNQLVYFNKDAKELGTICREQNGTKRLAYGINKKDSTVVYFDSLGIISSASYKTPKQPTPEDTLKYNLAPVDSSQYGKLGEIFGPVIKGE